MLHVVVAVYTFAVVYIGAMVHANIVVRRCVAHGCCGVRRRCGVHARCGAREHCGVHRSCGADCHLHAVPTWL
eukprot:1474982-Pyramimonas_sp.AAC.1